MSEEEVEKHPDDDDRELLHDDGTPYDKIQRWGFFHDAKYGYIAFRGSEYPRIEDQLDTLYHKGVEGWKAEIQKIKDKYPKP